MLGGEHKPLEAVQDKPSTKWHSIRDRFRYLFNPEHIANIERWYNTIAPRRHREFFREVSKAIHQHQAQPPPDPLTLHRAEHIMRLYGNLFTAEGAAKAKSWIMQAPTASGEHFKDVFAAAQATLTPVSTTKRAFTARELPEVQPKQFFRKRIDWESSRTAQFVREHASNPMDKHKVGANGATQPAVKRFTKPKRQFDAESVMKSLGVTEEGLVDLKEKRRAFEQENVYTVDDEGCTQYKTKQASRALAPTSNRIVVTSLGNTALGWISTSRELLRNPGVRTVEIIPADKHPAIARTTASLGFCVPHRDK